MAKENKIMCPKCFSQNWTNSGYIKKEKRYRCKDCNYYYTLNHITRIQFLEDYYDINESGCWIFNKYVTRYGYGRICHEHAHRYFYKIYKGKIPEGLTIDHLCKNKLCVNPEHLEVVSIKENKQRASVNHKSGKIELIREMYLTGKYCQYELAKIFNFNQGFISQIVTNKRWIV